MKLNFRKEFEEDIMKSFNYLKENSTEESVKKLKDVSQWITNLIRKPVYEILSIARTNGVDEEEPE